jgi:translation initiation factor 5A
MSWTLQQIRELKVGRYMVIDDEPCKIVDLTTSKPGKHGEAKARIVAVGMFDGAKRSVVYPVTHKVQVPMIDKRNAQVVSIQKEEVQLMDMENFEMFTLKIDEEMKAKLSPGLEVQIQEAMGRRQIIRT